MLLRSNMMVFKITSILLCLVAAGLMAAWYFVPKFLEQPAYKVLSKQGNIEIRQYDSMLLKSVKASGEQYKALRQGFRPLVTYIGAKKRDGDKISMTAPVMQSAGSTDNEWIVSFPMPSKYSKNNLPKSDNEILYTEDVEPSMAAVIRFSGKTNEDLLLTKSTELFDWLEKTKYKIQSKPKYLFYNDPSTPGFLRRNEVLVLVSQSGL